MSTVAFVDSSLYGLWKFKGFASTRLSGVHDLDRTGGASCGSETTQLSHLKSDQGLKVGKDDSSHDCPVGIAGSIEFEGLFSNGAGQPQRPLKTSPNSNQFQVCPGWQSRFAGSIARPATPANSETIQFDRPSVEGGHLMADPTAINPQETINPQDVCASTGSKSWLS